MRGWRIGAALLALVAGGCVHDHLTACDDGSSCPAGLVCDPAHHGCAMPDQLTACAGVADGTACQTSSLAGDCFDGVCLVPGCGNRVVEAGEQCDDGNHVGGDGCSGDCRSDERCGNGVVDGALGEACDDGNLASHDGCNSRCQPEAPAWTIEPAIVQDIPATSAFDAAHGQLVVVAHRVTWLWSGTAWSTSSALAPAVDQWLVATYDRDRARVVLIGKRGSALVVAEWDGTQWSEDVQAGVAPLAVSSAVYDPVRRAVFWFDNASDGYLAFGAAGATWSTIDTLPFAAGATHAAFDEAHGTVVVVDASGGGTWTYDGSAWSSVAAAPLGRDGHALVYDADRAQVLAVGGADTSAVRGEVLAWSGTSWDDTRARIPARSNAVVWHDASQHVIGIAGGADGSRKPLTDVLDLMGTTVVPHPVVQPTNSGPVAYDLARDAIIQSDLATGTYAWNGTWQQVSPTHVSNNATLVYDPVRAAVLAYDTGSVLELDTGWRVFTSAPATQTLTYDFARRGVVSVTNVGTSLLASVGDSSQMAIAPGAPLGTLTAAYDLGTHDIVAIAAVGTNAGLVELAGSQWMTSAFAPVGNYTVTSALQTASIVFVPGSGAAGAQLWERRAGAFREIGELPITGTIYGTVERGRGRLVLELSEGVGLVFLERQLTSDLPDETCTPTDDADGDGAAGCADPDCWQQCWPACPLATSCP